MVEKLKHQNNVWILHNTSYSAIFVFSTGVNNKEESIVLRKRCSGWFVRETFASSVTEQCESKQTKRQQSYQLQFGQNKASYEISRIKPVRAGKPRRKKHTHYSKYDVMAKPFFHSVGTNNHINIMQNTLLRH